jgi:hypothetical protein
MASISHLGPDTLCGQGGAARVGGRTSKDAQVCSSPILTRRRDTPSHPCIPHEGGTGSVNQGAIPNGARVSKFVNITIEDVFFEEQMILIATAKDEKSRYASILPELTNAKFLGHTKLATTQLYTESSTEMMRESSQRALGR